MKQTRFWLTTIVMLLSFCKGVAIDFSINGIYYNIISSSEFTVEVTGSNNSYGYSGHIEIPNKVEYNGELYRVTAIGNYAFWDCSGLISITIPNSVNVIKGGAFGGSTTRLSSVHISSIEAWCNIEKSYVGSNPLSKTCKLYLNGELVTELVIPDSVTVIKDYAFSNCYSLVSLTIPESVTRIGHSVFSQCTALRKVVIEDGSNVLSLGCNNYNSAYYTGDGLFYDCPLDSVYLGRILNYSSSSSYGYSPFYKEGRFPIISLGDDIASINDNLFYENPYLDSFIVPDGVNSIGRGAFYGCSNLTSITIPEGVENIGNDAFYGCSKLVDVYANNIDSWCKINFSNTNANPLCYATNLYINGVKMSNDLIIPNSVTSVKSYAFYGLTNLNSVLIGNSVLSIGNNIFSTTPKKTIWLTNTPPTGYANAKGSINYVANNQYTSLSNTKVYPYLSSMFEVDGVKYVPVSPSERTCHAIDCAYNSAAESINISETTSFKGVVMKVTEIMPYTFYGNNHIKEVSVSHLGNIGNYAFYNCDSIKIVNVSNQGNIGSQVFYDCDGIQSVELSNEGNIGNKAFYGCNGMLTAIISNQRDIESQAFYDCDSLRTLNLSNIGNVCDEAFSDCGALETALVTNTGTVNGSAFYGCASLNSVTLGDKVTSLGNEVFRGCTSLQEIVIPDSVKSVGTYCFYGCTAMKSVVIGDGLTDVKEYTFANCSGLESVTIGNGVTSISNYAFSVCSSLNDVEIGSSVATINNYAFQGCSSLPTITIPQAVTTIGDNVFAGCSSLADVVIADRTEPLALGSNGSSALFANCPLDSVYIGGKITYNTTSSKGYSPFYRNTSLRTVVITDREEQVYDNEFYGCTNLQNVTIGNGVKSIGNYAFSGCSSLAGFSFGSNMESIGAEAFSDCTNLTSITSHAAVPPTCGTQALDDINKWNCVLGVPLGNADAYYAADQWKEFFFIEDVVEVDHYVLTYVVDGEVVHTEVLKHKDEVTMLTEPTKVGYEFSGWDKTLATMPAEDVVISGTFVRLPIDNLVILDTEENFLIDKELECETVTYTRNFSDTQWQALYVPFEIPVTEEFLANFEVADLNNVHQYDHNDDGATDETVIEAFKVTSGTLDANYPYLIRAKETGEKSVVVTGDMLNATEENAIDCSSVREKFTFTGTYRTLSSDALTPGEGYYTLINGEWQLATEETTLGAFRFYLKVDSRNSNAMMARTIRMRIVGENGSDDDATGIEEAEIINQNSAVIYDLQGRRVENPTKGIYIVDGKKVVL